MRRVIAGVSVTEEGVLLVRKVLSWILPGGKPNVGEDDLSCLKRELGEELPGLGIVGQPVYFGQVSGIAPHTGDEVEVALYIIEAAGEITTAAEISEAVRTEDPLSLNLADATRKAIRALQQSGHL